MRKVKIGVLGVYRGSSMINYCNVGDNAEVVAICDKWEQGLNYHKEANEGRNIAYYTDYDEFLKHDFDAVVLANYAHQHAPFAIKALKAGKHVYSEVSPAQTMKEAVELVEAVEESGKIYMYGENYCYMRGTYEMYKQYRAGRIGEFTYGEGEYIHPITNPKASAALTYGNKNHWRYFLYSTYYCTHSLGPIIHITGLRPTHVIGLEGPQRAGGLARGYQQGCPGIEMVTLENGGIVKSIHGGLYKDSRWYSIYGKKGRMETARWGTNRDNVSRVFMDWDDAPGAFQTAKNETRFVKGDQPKKAKYFAHGGGDYYAMWHFCEKILGNPEADIIDVYEGLNMWLPGHFAYRSLLAGGVTMEIPDLRKKEDRDKWRDNQECTDPEIMGDKRWPRYSKGEAEIPDAVYDLVKKDWEAVAAQKNGALASSFRQGKKPTLWARFVWRLHHLKKRDHT